MLSFHHPKEGYKLKCVGRTGRLFCILQDHFPSLCNLEVKLCQKSLSCNIKTEEKTKCFNKKSIFA